MLHYSHSWKMQLCIAHFVCILLYFSPPSRRGREGGDTDVTQDRLFAWPPGCIAEVYVQFVHTFTSKRIRTTWDFFLA